jgi:hypothetical protein
MAFTITRTPLYVDLNADNLHVWKLSASVVSDTGLPSEVFVYHVLPTGSDIEEVFECVASLPQLSEIGTLPTTEGETIVPYYRKDSFELDCRSAEEAQEVWEAIREDLQDLLSNYQAASEMVLSETEILT